MMILSLTALTVLIYSVDAKTDCSGVKCLAVTCPSAFKPNGQCCLQCPPVGRCNDQVRASTPALEINHCNVRKDGHFNSKCRAVNCKDAFTPQGGCCPICPASCTYKSKTYQSGGTFKDRCNACSCHNGIVSCTNNECGCSYNGKTYETGDTFKADCNDCSCDDGSVTCTKKHCGNCTRCRKPNCSFFWSSYKSCRRLYTKWLKLILSGKCC